MSERRKNRKKKDALHSGGDGRHDEKPTKEECAIAKYLKQKLPEKKTTLMGHKVEYFISSKAIDCLLDSPWASNSKSDKDQVLFTNRNSIILFLDRMLQHKFFHRAKKIVVQKKKKDKENEEPPVAESKETTKEKKKKKTEETAEVTKETKEKKAKEKSENKEEKDDDQGGKSEDKKEGEAAEKKKEKKKFKLDMHLEQLFIDGNEVYVWIYDPIPMRTWIIGLLMVIGAVLVCLFPLWPQTIRHYIYYLSVAAAFFLAFIIGLAVIRLVVFMLIWAITFGRHHLWLLPNLTEDVGFFESFWPLYQYEYKGSKGKKKETDEKEKEEETKEEDSKEKDEEEKSDSSSDHGKKNPEMHSDSEHDSDADKEKFDNKDNGFEILNAEDADDEPIQEHDKDK